MFDYIQAIIGLLALALFFLVGLIAILVPGMIGVYIVGIILEAIFPE